VRGVKNVVTVVISAAVTVFSAVAAPASAQMRTVSFEPSPHVSHYNAAVRAPAPGVFTLTVVSGTAVAMTTIPDGCMPDSALFEQILNVEGEASAARVRPLTRTVLVCELGALDAGSESQLVLPIQDLATGTRTMTAQLHNVGELVDQMQWSHRPVTICAPPDGAPARQTDDAETAAAARADGRIAGTFHPDAHVLLTGIDACEQQIDRRIGTTGDGQFVFAGLLPGRYALLDEHGTVLEHVDLSDDSAEHAGIDLTAM
jgi:hypothetical protein